MGDAKTVGLAAMSAKPIHSGHWKLITKASTECDIVRIHVSLVDRARPDEIAITGRSMIEIWSMLMPSVPKNVFVILGHASPIRKLYEDLELLDKHGGIDWVAIYAGIEDAIKSFTVNNLRKSAPSIFLQGKIRLRTVARTNSGTAMRRHLENNDKKVFAAGLPSPLADRVDDVWRILKRA